MLDERICHTIYKKNWFLNVFIIFKIFESLDVLVIILLLFITERGNMNKECVAICNL